VAVSPSAVALSRPTNAYGRRGIICRRVARSSSETLPPKPSQVPRNSGPVIAVSTSLLFSLMQSRIAPDASIRSAVRGSTDTSATGEAIGVLSELIGVAAGDAAGVASFSPVHSAATIWQERIASGGSPLVPSSARAATPEIDNDVANRIARNLVR